jgi:hypothetical protein
MLGFISSYSLAHLVCYFSGLGLSSSGSQVPVFQNQNLEFITFNILDLKLYNQESQLI